MTKLRWLLPVLWLNGCSCPPKIAKPFNEQRMGSGAETTVAVVPTGPNKRNYVIGFIGGATWTVSTDQGATWTLHNSSDPGFDWGQPPEKPVSSYGIDPTLVATGHPNQVAFVSIADLHQVVIAISTDGGIHFGNVHLVNLPSDAAWDPEPSAAVNATTGQIWVAWTQTERKKLMLRALHYDVAGSLTFDTDPIELNALLPGLGNLKLGDDVNVTVAAGNYQGKSHVAIAWEDHYDPYEGVPPTCPGTLDLRYYIADSDDGGKTWTSLQIVHDAVWPQCVTDVPAEGYNRNRPAIAFAGGIDLTYYVALTRSSPTGSLVHLYSIPWPFDQTKIHDFSSNPPQDGAHHDQFFPAIAVGYSLADVTDPARTAMNVMVTWHDTRADVTGANLQQLIYGSVTGLGSWTGVMSPAVGIANEHVPWVNQQWYGDYEGLASDDISHGFIAVWTDNRIDGPPAVWSSVLTPLNP